MGWPPSGEAGPPLLQSWHRRSSSLIPKDGEARSPLKQLSEDLSPETRRKVLVHEDPSLRRTTTPGWQEQCACSHKVEGTACRVLKLKLATSAHGVWRAREPRLKEHFFRGVWDAHNWIKCSVRRTWRQSDLPEQRKPLRCARKPK